MDTLFDSTGNPRKKFDWDDFALASQSDPSTLPNDFIALINLHHDNNLKSGVIGYEERAMTAVMGNRTFRNFYGDTWGGSPFLPIMWGDHGYTAFDLRGDMQNDLPVVFLDVSQSPAFQGEDFGDVSPVAPTFQSFLSRIGVWQQPSSLPPAVVDPTAAPVFRTLGVNRPDVLSLLEGRVLRSGIMECGGHRLEIPYLLDATPDPKSLSLETQWQEVSEALDQRVIPVMTGRDGWLALDYRETDSEPPVVVICRTEGHPNGKVAEIAASLTEAFDLYLPGPISDSIHQLEGLS